MDSPITTADYVRLYSKAGFRLEQARKREGLGQRKLALAAKIGHNTVHRIESGEHQMTVLTAIALASVLECTPEWLLFGVTYE